MSNNLRLPSSKKLHTWLENEHSAKGKSSVSRWIFRLQPYKEVLHHQSFRIVCALSNLRRQAPNGCREDAAAEVPVTSSLLGCSSHDLTYEIILASGDKTSMPGEVASQVGSFGGALVGGGDVVFWWKVKYHQ